MTTPEGALKTCDSRDCEREHDQWAKFAGAGYTEGSVEHFWWDVFEGLLERMCQR